VVEEPPGLLFAADDSGGNELLFGITEREPVFETGGPRIRRRADAEALYARVPNGTVVVIECGAYGELGGSLRTLKNGDRSSMVRAVQRKLRALGFYFGTPDGIFGSATQRAVDKARKTFSLSANGLVDWALYQKLGLTLFE